MACKNESRVSISIEYSRSPGEPKASWIIPRLRSSSIVMLLVSLAARNVIASILHVVLEDFLFFPFFYVPFLYIRGLKISSGSLRPRYYVSTNLPRTFVSLSNHARPPGSIPVSGHYRSSRCWHGRDTRRHSVNLPAEDKVRPFGPKFSIIFFFSSFCFQVPFCMGCKNKGSVYDGGK